MDFALQASGAYDTLLAAARWSEERGLVCFAIPDHYVMSLTDDAAPAEDAFALLAALARDTESIRLSVLVSPITFRHPAVLAKTGITIDRLSGGRFTLGIGTGWLEREHEIFGFDFPPIGERFDRTEEALAYVRAVTTGEGFDGRFYQLQPAALEPKPTPGFEIVVGGKGPNRTPTLAGRYADEYNAYPAEKEEMKRRIDLARASAAEMGRDPDRLIISSAGQVVVGRDEADYRERLAALAAESGATPEQLEEHFRFRNTPRGTSEQIQEQLAEMESIGVSRFYLQTGWPDDLERIGETLDLMTGI